MRENLSEREIIRDIDLTRREIERDLLPTGKASWHDIYVSQVIQCTINTIRTWHYGSLKCRLIASGRSFVVARLFTPDNNTRTTIIMVIIVKYNHNNSNSNLEPILARINHHSSSGVTRCMLTLRPTHSLRLTVVAREVRSV